MLTLGERGRAVAVVCKVCDRGSLIPTKKYRLSGPVVFIGYILLIPSVLGVLFCAFSFATLSALMQPGEETATGLAGGIFIILGIASFVGGLLGWLLVMKKKVLLCNSCGAAINAS